MFQIKELVEVKRSISRCDSIPNTPPKSTTINQSNEKNFIGVTKEDCVVSFERYFY